MPATAATAKFSTAYGPWPKIPVTDAAQEPGSGFDCRMLSTTILMGHGSRMSVSVSPSTATSASVSAFQCGRTRSMILASRRDHGRDAGAAPQPVAPGSVVEGRRARWGVARCRGWLAESSHVKHARRGKVWRILGGGGGAGGGGRAGTLRKWGGAASHYTGNRPFERCSGSSSTPILQSYRGGDCPFVRRYPRKEAVCPMSRVACR